MAYGKIPLIDKEVYRHPIHSSNTLIEYCYLK